MLEDGVILIQNNDGKIVVRCKNEKAGVECINLPKTED